jgi:hypothetical protein
MRHHRFSRGPVQTVGIVTLDDLLRLLVADASALLGIMNTAQSHEQHSRR